jgi:alkylation response protein AidB-like acyl-CoA dehydrogenase
MSLLAQFLAWRRKKIASRLIAQAEHARRVTMAQIAERKEARREHKPLLHPLRQATMASLRAYVEARG